MCVCCRLDVLGVIGGLDVPSIEGSVLADVSPVSVCLFIDLFLDLHGCLILYRDLRDDYWWPCVKRYIARNVQELELQERQG